MQSKDSLDTFLRNRNVVTTVGVILTEEEHKKYARHNLVTITLYCQNTGIPDTGPLQYKCGFEGTKFYSKRGIMLGKHPLEMS